MRKHYSAPIAFAVTGALALGSVAATATSAQAADAVPKTSLAAAGWLTTQLSVMSDITPGSDLTGVLADAIIGITATSTGQTAAATATDALAALTTAYTEPQGAGSIQANKTSKILVAATVQNRDVEDFGGVNLKQNMTDTMATSGDSKGQFTDVGMSDTFTENTFSQSLGIIGLARNGGAPKDAIDFLLTHQCPNGGFELLLEDGGCKDNNNAGTQATGMALQALTAPGVTTVQPDAGEAITKAGTWLVAQQGGDGSFGDKYTPANANSTGIATAGLKAAGATEAAAKAAEWLESIQLNCDNAYKTPAKDDLGAVAYDSDSFNTAKTSGIQSRKQFQFATAQGLLGMGGTKTYTTATSVGSAAGATRFSCTSPKPPVPPKPKPAPVAKVQTVKLKAKKKVSYRSKKNQVVIKSLPKTNAGLKVKVKAKIKKKLGKVKVAKNGKVTFRAKRKKGTFTITLTAPAVRGAHPFKAYKKVIKVRIK